MAILKLYGFSRINALAHGLTRDLRVLWALEEMELPFELVGLDHPAGDLRTPAYRRVSPFEQIPVLEDGSVVLSESGAILLYLARKSGKLMPADANGEAQVIRWCFTALDSVELATLNILLIDGGFGIFADHPSQALRAMWVDIAHRFLDGLERWLDGREFIATDAFTVADILMALVLSEIKDEQILAPYARVVAYRERCLARPAWQRVNAHVSQRLEGRTRRPTVWAGEDSARGRMSPVTSPDRSPAVRWFQSKGGNSKPLMQIKSLWIKACLGDALGRPAFDPWFHSRTAARRPGLAAVASLRS